MASNSHQDLLTCSFCENIFDSPVVLPCNGSICLKDVHEIALNQSLDCPVCSECHTIPDNGFPSDVKLEYILSVNNTKQQKNPINITRLNELYKKYAELKENPFRLIEQHFNEIRKLIEQFRIDNKQIIDDLFDQFLKETYTYELDAKSRITQVLNPYPSDNDSNSSDYLKGKINDLVNKANSNGFNADNFKLESTKLEKKIEKKLADLEKSVQLKNPIAFKGKLLEKPDLGKFERKKLSTGLSQSYEAIEVTDQNYYMAMKDYRANVQEELSYKKGDILSVKSTRGTMWSAVRSEKIGLIDPRNFKEYPDEEWFFKSIGREQAEEYLKHSSNKRGAFLIRISSASENQMYTLSILKKNNEIKHYKILGALRADGVWEYWLNGSRTKFTNLKSLVTNFTGKSDGHGIELTHPCHKN